MIGIHQNYEQKAGKRENEDQRQIKQTVEVLKFNNWIKSVLISEYSKEMCEKVERILDMPRGKRDQILNVFDIGCGRGQDLLKWKLARVRYMVATDFSEECIKAYQERWKGFGEPFRLYLVAADFTKLDLYNKIEHAYYDIVSAQFCLHYMFKTKQELSYGLANILSNLLQGGVFIATIPDSYSILRKINQKGTTIGGHTYYGNKYFSLKFSKTNFTEQWGNEYGFYLQEAVGSKDKETGEILYTNQWLISLDYLESVLQNYGVTIQYTKNFLEFYMKHRDNQQYKNLFIKVGLNFDIGKSMDPDLWEIAHLYRVLVCRKIRNEKKKLNQYTLDQRLTSYKGKQIARTPQQDRRGQWNNNSNNRGGQSHSRGKGQYYNKSNNYNNSHNHRN